MHSDILLVIVADWQTWAVPWESWIGEFWINAKLFLAKRISLGMGSAWLVIVVPAMPIAAPIVATANAPINRCLALEMGAYFDT